ncbi:MAG TPA: hypothetical protein VN541_09185, partial [Tepidisphaeraceae bacterium]|nr:hypothetical protein [Tepidisphaeraceae bacterium]
MASDCLVGYYSDFYFDAANRQIASVDVGTNNGQPWMRPSTPPAELKVTRTFTSAVRLLILRFHAPRRPQSPRRSGVSRAQP